MEPRQFSSKLTDPRLLIHGIGRFFLLDVGPLRALLDFGCPTGVYMQVRARPEGTRLVPRHTLMPEAVPVGHRQWMRDPIHEVLHSAYAVVVGQDGRKSTFDFDYDFMGLRPCPQAAGPAVLPPRVTNALEFRDQEDYNYCSGKLG